MRPDAGLGLSGGPRGAGAHHQRGHGQGRCAQRGRYQGKREPRGQGSPLPEAADETRYVRSFSLPDRYLWIMLDKSV